MIPCETAISLALLKIPKSHLTRRNDLAIATSGRRQVNVMLVLVAPGRHPTPQQTNLSTRNANQRKEMDAENLKEKPVAPIREVDNLLEALIARLEATPRTVPSLAMPAKTVVAKEPLGRPLTIAVAPLDVVKTRIVEPSHLAKARVKEIRISLNLACVTYKANAIGAPPTASMSILLSVSTLRKENVTETLACFCTPQKKSLELRAPTELKALKEAEARLV